MTRKLPCLALILLVLSLLFTACPTQFELQMHEGHHNFSGIVSGMARGWSSDIRVELYLRDGVIQTALVYSVPGTGSETPGFARALTMAPPIILATNNVELDTLAGATVTTNAIIAAGREALALIPPPGAIPQVREPGTFVEEANGWGGVFLVTVTLSNTAITNIIVESSNESQAVGQLAIPILIERMLFYQTSQVDGVSGATATTAALRNTVDTILRAAGAPLFMLQPPTGPDGRINSLRRPVDVLIIGSGAAGLSAAIEAASFIDPANPFAPPVSVTLIEKDYMLGGSTRFSSGIIYAAENQTDANFAPGVANLRNYFLFRAHDNANAGLIDTLVEKSWELVNTPWWALPPLSQSFPIGMASASRARGVSGSGTGLVRTLENRARELGVNIMTGIEAYELRTHQGAVVQVRARSRTTNFTFDVRRGTVIATGGFDNDRGNVAGSPMENHNPDPRNIVSLSSPGNVGDGIRMARDVGAASVYRGGRFGWAIVPVPTVNVAVPSGANILAVRSGGAVIEWLDLSGPEDDWDNNPHDLLQTRNPEDDLSLVFAALMRQLDRDTVGVAPTQFLQISNEPFPAVGFVNHSFLSGFGVAFSFPTVDSFWYNIFNHLFLTPQSTLIARLTERNLMDSGRPFYIWPVQPASLGSMGGLRIDPQARVLRGGVNDAVMPTTYIPGLFAAGEVANGDFFYQQNPAMGSSLGIALTFGRIAGQQAAGTTPRTLLP